MAGTSKPPLSLRFHTETNPNGGDEFTLKVPLPDSNQTLCLSKVAVISEQDVMAIFPFPANDGTQGCALKLDEHGRIALDTLSQESRGTMLLGFLNTRLVSAVQIDRHVTSGVLYIARGLTPQEIGILSKHFPALGAKKKSKKGAPQATPAPMPPAASFNPSTARGD
jgi:hypothetical protein